MSDPQPTQICEPVFSSFKLGLAHDSATGDVFLTVKNGVIPMGNTRTGDLYLQRVYLTKPGDAGPVLPSRHDVGWKYPEDQAPAEPFEADHIAFQSMMLNYGWLPQISPDAGATIDHYLNATADEVLPRIAGGGLNGVEIVRRAASVGVRWREGRAAPHEISEALDLVTTYLSILPEEMLTAKVSLQSDMPEPSRLILPPSTLQ